MVPIFPKQIANKGIIIYLISLASVSLIFSKYAMGIEYLLIGLICVIGFFTLSSVVSKRLASLSSIQFRKTVFWMALAIRIVWVVFSTYFFISKTGKPFEFQPSDGPGYHDTGLWLMSMKWNQSFFYLFKSGIWPLSDTGYSLWLTIIYKLIGPHIFIVKCIKALLSAFSCCLVYKLSARVINETTGRLASIFCLFMPNLIIYCGMYLKETEMIFLMLAFLERTDSLLRNKKYDLFSVGLPLLLALSLFTYRTVLGVIAIFSLLTALFFMNERIISRARRLGTTIWIILAILILGGGTIANEVEGYWEARVTNQVSKREMQTERGNQWAKYATGTVLAPMIFVMPFSTMVDMQQYNQELTHGGNFVRNYFGIFVLLALFYSIFKYKNWKDFSLIGSFLISYLAVISFSGYGNSERFLLPGAPLLLILSAYGITLLDKNNIKYVNIWASIVILMEFGWAFFKVGSRGLLGL